MTPDRFHQITSRYPQLRIAVFGDFSLDRYLEIDSSLSETSIETGLEVHNVTQVRSQPGAGGTILNNLVSLGVGQLYPVGFAGEDGEGYELIRAMKRLPRVHMENFLQTPLRRTFTYTKPLLMEPGKPPRELNRLDFKNWSPTPPILQGQFERTLNKIADRLDGIALLEQVDLPETGVVTSHLLQSFRNLSKSHPQLPVIADSRRSLANYPPLIFKMNKQELGALTQASRNPPLREIKERALQLAETQGQKVFITLAEQGIVGAAPNGIVEHQPSFPVHGEIDIVGAGDAVTANLLASLAAGAALQEAITLANAAASIVIHQLGTTGTASVQQLQQLV